MLVGSEREGGAGGESERVGWGMHACMSCVSNEKVVFCKIIALGIVY